MLRFITAESAAAREPRLGTGKVVVEDGFDVVESEEEERVRLRDDMFWEVCFVGCEGRAGQEMGRDSVLIVLGVTARKDEDLHMIVLDIGLGLTDVDVGIRQLCGRFHINSNISFSSSTAV